MDVKTKAEIEMLEAQTAFWLKATKLVEVCLATWQGEAWSGPEKGEGPEEVDEDEGIMGAVGSVLERHGVDPKDV